MFLFFPAALLAFCGWLVKYKKMAFLISGYNTSSAKKKAQYDLEKLCRYTGNFIFSLAAVLAIMATAFTIFGMTYPVLYAGVGLFLADVVFGLVYLNTGGRLKKR